MNSKEKKSILQKELNIKEIFIVISVFVIFFSYVYVFIYPKYSEFIESRSNLESLQSQSGNLEDEIAQMSIIEKNVESLENELKVKSKILSYDIQDGMFLIGLSNLMSEVDVDLIQYSVEDIKQYDNFYALPATIQVRGSYKNVREIMHYLEKQENMTQVLDFDIKTYEEEEDISQSENISSIVPDNTVYWTNSGTLYHKQDCPVLQLESNQSGEEIQSGSAYQSGKNTPDENCKPYTELTELNNNTTPKASGIVTATFKFISYSSQNPLLEFNNDDPTTWKPGKYNPFKTTSR